MSELLLNAPLWIIVLLAILGLGLLVPALRSSNRHLTTAALVCFVAAALLAGTRYLVPTPQKTVEKETRRLADAVGKSDWATISELVKNANFYDMQGQEIADRLKLLVSTYSLSSLRVNSTESVRTDTVITVTLSVTTHHEKSYADTVPSSWNLDWQKRGGSWILTDIRPIRIGTLGISEAESLIH